METTENKLRIPQNYSLAIRIILLCIISELCCVVQRYKGERVSLEQNAVLFDINTVTYVWVLFIERKYLLNFFARKAILFINWLIGLTVLLYAFMFFVHYNTSINVHTRALIALFFMLFLMYFMFRYALELIQIKNDFIGLLKVLGIFNILLVIVTILGMFQYFILSRAFLAAFYGVNISIFIILILIMLRAQKLTKTNNTN